MSGVDVMGDGDLKEMGEMVNEARPVLVRISDFLARRAWKGRLTLPLTGGHVALVLTPEDARRVRELLG